MQSNFVLKPNELNIDFLNGLKSMFAGRTVKITVSDVVVDDSSSAKNSANAEKSKKLPVENSKLGNFIESV